MWAFSETRPRSLATRSRPAPIFLVRAQITPRLHKFNLDDASLAAILNELDVATPPQTDPLQATAPGAPINSVCTVSFCH